MAKYFAKESTQTENMYGFPAVVVAITIGNLNHLRTLKQTYESVRELDININRITYYSSVLDVEVLNDSFLDDFQLDGDNKVICDISDEQYEKYSNEYDTDYRVESPNLYVDGFGFGIAWNSKWTSDEVYVQFDWETLDAMWNELG